MEEHKRYLIERQRADSYRLFAACFHPPAKTFFAKEDLLAALNNTLKLSCSEAAQHAWEMRKALLHSSIEELQDEYARLFRDSIHLTEPKYGSFFFEGNERVMEDIITELKIFYEDSGFKHRDNNKEPPDHIALQLEFFSYISVKIAESILDGNKTTETYYRNIQKDFFSGFFSKRLINLLELVKKNAHHDLYRSLAKCIESYISCEKNITGWQWPSA